jgi:preprotein translocase subunit SecG
LPGGELAMPSFLKWTISFLVGAGIVLLGWRIPVLLNAFFVLLCLVLIIVVLLQSGKAADLAGAFGGAGSQTAFGPRGAANFLSRATTWCAVMFMICALALVLRQDRTVSQGSSVLENTSRSAPKKSAPAPVQPVQQPAQAPASQPSGPGNQPKPSSPAPK